MGDVGAESAFGFDEAFPFQRLVDLDDGEGIDVELRREITHGGELRTVEKLAGKDALLELLLQLHIKGDAAGGVEEEHGVIVQ